MNMTPQTLQQMQDNADAAEQLLKSLANANRLKILCQLVAGECCVGELEQRVSLSQSALSQHLAKMREQGIVTCRKAGTTVYYRVASQPAMDIMIVLHSVYCSD